MTTEPIKKNIWLFIAGILLLACFSGFFAYKSFRIYSQEQRIEQRKQEKAEIAAKQKQYKEIQKLFDQYLNDFKKDIETAVLDYRRKQSVLKEIFLAENFETYEYAKETHRIYHEDIMPALQKQADDTLSIFRKYDQKIENDMSSIKQDENVDLKKIFYRQWQKMNKSQTKKYVAHFENQENILNAYSDLMNFYLKSFNHYTVDMEKNEFVFKSDDQKKQADDLKRKIESIRGG